MSERLPLHGLSLLPAPVVRPLAVYRRAKRLLRAWCAQGLAPGVGVWLYLTDLAMLEELWAQCRAAVREEKREAREKGSRSGRAAARFAASPKGRRYYRAIDEASMRVQGWENALCG